VAFLIDDMLTLPVKGLLGIFKEIHKYVDRELNDITHWQKKLLELQLQYEIDEIDEDQYKILEQEIVERISEIQNRGKD
jgi:hypothetical protein